MPDAGTDAAASDHTYLRIRPTDDSLAGARITEQCEQLHGAVDATVECLPVHDPAADELRYALGAPPDTRPVLERVLARLVPDTSRREAFDRLYEVSNIGQKIANEFLRIAVDVLEYDTDWDEQLHVALDTNVVQALIKTGAIELDPSEADRSADRVVNMDPESTPRKLIGYIEVQQAFAEAAEQIGEPRIVFDELWTEHRAFIADPLLRSQSVFSEFLD